MNGTEFEKFRTKYNLELKRLADQFLLVKDGFVVSAINQSYDTHEIHLLFSGAILYRTNYEKACKYYEENILPKVKFRQIQQKQKDIEQDFI